MPLESIGDVDTGQMPHDEEWILFAIQLAISYVEHVCGKPPRGCSLGVMWHDHELGSYPSMGLEWDPNLGAFEPPADYIQRCEIALEAFGEAVNWSVIEPDSIDERFSEAFDDEE